MKRFLFLAGSLLSVSAAASTGAMTADQIVAKNIEARGGLKAWRAVDTMTLTGKLEAGSKADPELPFVLKMKKEHKSRIELRFKEQTAVQVWDGANGWKVRPYLGRNEVEPFTAQEAKAAQDWQQLDGPLVDYKAKGTRVALQGSEEVEGKKAYKLELTMKDGTHRHTWIDAKSFLELKTEGEPRILDGKMRNVYVYYRDYRPEHGLTLPHTFETVAETAPKPYRMHVDQVNINQAMADDIFAKPQLAASAR